MASAGGKTIADVAEPKGSSTAKETAALPDGEDEQDSEDEQDVAVLAATEEEDEAKSGQDGKVGKDPEKTDDEEMQNLGNSITQRCTKRLKWAKEGCDMKSSSYWVCKDANCATKLCKVYHELLESKMRLSKAENELNEEKKELKTATQRIVQLLGVIVEERKQNVQKSEVIVQETCEVLLKRHDSIKEVLMHGKAAGNRTNYKTEQTNVSQVQRELEIADREAADVNVGSKTDNPKSPSKIHKCLNEDCKKYAINRSFETNEELKKFWDFCDDMFRISHVVPHSYESQAFAKCIEETCNHITSWNKETSIDANINYYRPFGVAQETKAVQPILFALMWKIARILGGTMHLTKEQFLPREEEKSKRCMDGMWSEVVKQHLGAANGCLLGKSLEIKPLSRKGGGKGFTKMVSGGENQEIGHMFQTLWDDAFQYCRGLGKDGRASGIVLTMASAMLLDVNISGTGTSEAKLTSRNTGNQPLFSEATSKVLFTDCEDGKGLDKSNLIFAVSPDKGTERVMQKGFTNLVHFVMDLGNKKEEVNASAEIRGNKIKIQIKKILGSGAFCAVHTARIDNEDTNVIIKIAKDETQSLYVLKNELQALKVLNHSSIPKLYTQSLVNIMVHQRCERNWVQALILQVDEGETVGKACKIGGLLCGNTEYIEYVFEQTKKALKYAHGQNFVHMDIQPSNIIIKIVYETAEISVLLNDWGSAAQKPKTLKYYTGTPPFSHDDLMRTDPKKPFTQQLLKPEFDLFSLSMTICYLLNRGMPWDGFNSPLVTQSMLDKRATTALGLIENSTLSVAHKVTLKADANLPQSPKSDVNPSQNRATVPVEGAALKRKRLARNAATSSSKRCITTPDRLTHAGSL